MFEIFWLLVILVNILLNIYSTMESNFNIGTFNCTGAKSSFAHEADAVCVLGDFNAHCNTAYFEELRRSCEDNALVVADMMRLPADNHTHFSTQLHIMVRPCLCVRKYIK